MYENEPIYIDDGVDAPRADLPFVERNAVVAVLRNPRTNEYLGLRWKKGVDWETFVTGGVEEGQTPEEAARAEVYEETGYKNLRLVKEFPRYHAKFYHTPKGENRFAHFQPFLFELVDEEQDPISEKELEKHEPVWLDAEALAAFRLVEPQRLLLKDV